MTTATFANGSSTSFGPSFVQNPYTNPFVNQGRSTFTSPFTSPFVNQFGPSASSCCLIWDCNGCCYVCGPTGQCSPVSCCSTPAGYTTQGIPAISSTPGFTFNPFNSTVGIGSSFNPSTINPWASTPWNYAVSPWNLGGSTWNCNIPSSFINPFNCSPFNCSPFNCFPTFSGQGFGMPTFGVPFGFPMPYNYGIGGFNPGVQGNQGDQQLRNNG